MTRGMWSKVGKRMKGPKSLPGSIVLRRMFKKVSRDFRLTHTGVFLDIFSGEGSIAKYISKLGFPVISIDVSDDPRFDVTDPAVAAVIFGWIKSGCVLGIWLATPCTSWSRARRGPANSSWGPIRSNHFIYGLPNISFKDQQKVKVGNQTMSFSTSTIRLAIHHKVPVFLENPHSSMLWLAPPLVKLIGHPSSRAFLCDFCQFGARWRKRTRIQAWFSQDSITLNQICHGRNGICSRTGKHHIVLSGQDRVSQQLWTHLAQPYPLKFAEAGAQLLISSYEHMRSFQLKKHFGL